MKRVNDGGGEQFLSRWSRLKRASREPLATDAEDAPQEPMASNAPSAGAAAVKDRRGGLAPASTGEAGRSTTAATDESMPVLPSIDSLTIDSDFSPFFQPKVPEAMRRAAVKKLFADPHFNVMDGLDTYIDDYSKPDPIPEAMLRSLRHAKGFFEPVRDPLEALAAERSAAAAPDEEAIAPADPVSASNPDAPVPDAIAPTDAASSRESNASTRIDAAADSDSKAAAASDAASNPESDMKAGTDAATNGSQSTPDRITNAPIGDREPVRITSDRTGHTPVEGHESLDHASTAPPLPDDARP